MTGPASDFSQRLRPPGPEPSDPIAASGDQQRGAIVSKAVGHAEVALIAGYGLGTKAIMKRAGKSRGGQGVPQQDRAGNSGR